MQKTRQVAVAVVADETMWIEVDEGNTFLNIETGASFHRGMATVLHGRKPPALSNGQVVFHSKTNQRVFGQPGLVIKADWEALRKQLFGESK